MGQIHMTNKEEQCVEDPLSSNKENQATEDLNEQDLPEATENALLNWIDTLNHHP